VVTAISQQNIQVAAGQIGQQPAPKGQQFQLTINTLGRLTDPDQFGDIIIKAGQGNATASASQAGQTSQAAPTGQGASISASTPTPPATGIVRLRDVVTRTSDGHPRVELGSQQYEQSCTLD